MSRALCQQCQRPKNACICAFAVKIDNDIPVIVLQHPNEVSQSKGTVSLLKQSLIQCEVIVGENFENSAVLLQRLKQYEGNIVLLYPSEHAITLDYSQETKQKLIQDCNTDLNVEITSEKSNNNESVSIDENVVKSIISQDNLPIITHSELNNIQCIIILDGTWKKAYRMFMLNPCLHKIKHIVLPVGISSLYEIRKTKKDNALSSLEACCHALARLENNPEKYQVLLSSFVKFNQFQQSFTQARS